MRNLLLILFSFNLCSIGISSSIKDYVTKDELDQINDTEEVTVSHSTTPKGFNFAFSAFGQDFNLQLEKNDKLISPTAQIVTRNGNDIKSIGTKDIHCHYIHKGDDYVASISLCGENNAYGYITTTDGRTFEVMELSQGNGGITKRNGGNETSSRQDKMLKIKRASLQKAENSEPIITSLPTPSKRSGSDRRVIETAVFVDPSVIRKFDPFFQESPENIRDFIVSYMNGVQSLYHHTSLEGLDFDLSIVRLELLESQPSNLPTHGGERSLLLKSFCKYQSSLNTNKNGEAGHWDLGIYVSGIDFYADSNGKTSYGTMGLSPVSGICTEDYNCVIAELGVNNKRGKPYPSAGFTSVYVLAHELGHNLGLHHDGRSGNTCDKNGFIMSASRGTKGESTWSKCSMEKLKSQEHKCLENDPASPSDHPLGKRMPGQNWNMNKQCQILLLDFEAAADHSDDTLEDICYTLKCQSPKRLGLYRAGPALEGTSCGKGKWCLGGICVKSEDSQAPTPGKWSEWSEGTCESSCLDNSKGYRIKKRTCLEGNCVGKSVSHELCDDSSICKERTSIPKFANKACASFIAYRPELTGLGAMVKYSSRREDQSCTVYCKWVGPEVSKWYTPTMEVNDIPNVDNHFPDGTLCHKDDDGNKYYCLRYKCILEGARSGKSTAIKLNINQNAPLSDKNDQISDALQDFFSLNEDKTPIKSTIDNDQLENSNGEEEYEDNDIFEF
ncbi:A disintegrin and metalloproteinase with thrombospondin motifs adt-1-like [Lepeophtheirus salmonis]|uniref:A disintegrin and metalloproteinase with thrombospondin motifs adt-1-like n=1 Tax=Lepeophtheirus salmonis TaxID=72036 RepID=UPI001AE5818D|nr:A disintegrin and metalloproteinase with thrombospondin motifs adt-1-like [Lepeophtheirus salmonis]